MVLGFWPDVAPKTVENFKTLAKKGFYDGTAFHRIVKGFMIQGGDPLTRDPKADASWGTGGPGYTIKAEFSERSHCRGTISMARSATTCSASSVMSRPWRVVAKKADRSSARGSKASELSRPTRCDKPPVAAGRTESACHPRLVAHP
jgi:hypothetical protein